MSVDARKEEFDVFISYQHLDADFANSIAERLEAEEFDGRKLKVFFAPWEIGPADDIVTKLDEGLSKARFYFLVLSPEALLAEWPTAERAAAIYADPSGRLGRVIPAMRRACKLPPLLAYRQYLDFRQVSLFEAEYARLVSKVTGRPLRHRNTSQMAVERPTDSRVTQPQVSVGPDDIQERIYSNLFPMKNLPLRTYSAPTKFVGRKEVYASYPQGAFVPPFILKKGRLYTFVDLSADVHAFKGITEEYDIAAEASADWLKSEDRARWLVELLNDCVRPFRYSMHMSVEPKGKRLYFQKGVLTNERIKWKGHVRAAGRHLVKERKNKLGQTVCFVHRAVTLTFDLLHNDVYLKIESGRVFTTDGRELIEGRRRAVLSTRSLARQRNLAAFDDIRFWVWLISEDGRVIKMRIDSTQELEVETSPLSLEIRGGIYGDDVPFPETVETPPELIEPAPTNEENPDVDDGLDAEGEIA